MLPTYIKINNKSGKNFLTVKTSLHPIVGTNAVFTVLGPADTTSYTINGTPTQNFQESEKDFASVLDGLTTQSAPPTAKSDDTPKSKGKKEDSLTSPALQLISLTENLRNWQKVAWQTGDSNSWKSINKLFNANPDLKKRIDKLVKDKDIVKRQIASLQFALEIQKKENQTLKDTLAAQNQQILALKDSLAAKQKTIDSLIRIIVSSLSVKTLGEKMAALERDLEIFIADHDDISFFEKEYSHDLACLQNSMKEILQIPVPDSPADLSQLLTNLVKRTDLSKMYYDAFSEFIKVIETRYKTAMSLKAKYSFYSVAKKVDNVDEYTITVKSPKGIDFGFSDNFRASLGLKIDFSTGIYVGGLANSNFVVAAHQFSYKERRDTVNVSNGNIDPVYTGRLIDTTGNLIQENKPRYSYSAGFLAHVYTRTGSFINAGLATGITITNSNSSPLQLMLGLSVMFNTGKSRVSLSGGLVYGQVKTLSSVAVPYKWDETKDKTIYNSKNDLPIFYTASSDIPTYERWAHSYFVGLSYNFASLNVGK